MFTGLAMDCRNRGLGQLGRFGQTKRPGQTKGQNSLKRFRCLLGCGFGYCAGKINIARPPRADEAGGLYHALKRWNLRAEIFHKEEDFAAFERILHEGL